MVSEKCSFEEGQHVKIADDLKGSKTQKKYSLAQEMINMSGKVYPIHRIVTFERIRIKHKDNIFVFHPDDLSVVSDKPNYPEPAIFDPGNLSIS